jgi:hypothetical protein
MYGLNSPSGPQMRKDDDGGVSAAPRSRIQFDFKLAGIRYRPTLRRPPSEANLRLAREHLGSIKQQIAVGTFSFPNEFPDYRYLRRVVGYYLILQPGY